MIKIKKLNSFSLKKPKKNSFIEISNKKLKVDKKVKFRTPEALRILTPNSISIKSRNSLKLDITDKKTQNKINFLPEKKIVFNSIENKNIEKRPKSRFNLTPSNKLLKRENENLVKYIKGYPKTFYQKIFDNIEKMKINADRTIKKMKNNLRLTNHEAFLRATNVININTLINRGLKLKKESLAKINNKRNSEMDIDKYNDEEKTQKIEEISERELKHSKSNSNLINSSINNKKYFLGLRKISLRPFYTIKLNDFYVPLYKESEKNKFFYKNMYHIRFGEIRSIRRTEVSKKIYDAPYILNFINSFIKQPEIQLKNIYDKLNILLNNISYFYNNFLIKKEFRHAFINMENQIKAQLNSNIEEVCILILKLIPLILKEFYYSLSQLLFINIPQIDEEIEKMPENEIECLKFNIHFFGKIKEYFSACVEIYYVIQKQIAEFKFTPNEFNTLNNILDLARYNSTSLISMAKTQIEKTKNDDDIFYNFEIGLKIKKKRKNKNENGFERYHNRRKIKYLNDKEKINRIKSALNIGTKRMDEELNVNLNQKNIKSNKISSIFNSFLIKDMMKYFNSEIREQIISQQVIERFKKMELERLKFDHDNIKINDGTTIKIGESPNEKQNEKNNEEF